MRFIFGLLAAAVGIYSLLIFIRIIISWFSGGATGKFVDFLSVVTDPYLDWWRRNLNLRLGFLDFSSVAAIAFLYLIQNLLYSFINIERITVGNILAIVLISLWPIVSFILGLSIILLILRLFAYITNRDMYGSFWRVIDAITQPLLYRMNRIIYGNKIPSYVKGIIVSILVLTALWIGGKLVIPLIIKLLVSLPI